VTHFTQSMPSETILLLFHRKGRHRSPPKGGRRAGGRKKVPHGQRRAPRKPSAAREQSPCAPSMPGTVAQSGVQRLTRYQLPGGDRPRIRGASLTVLRVFRPTSSARHAPSTHAPSSLQNIRLSSDLANSLSRSRNSWADGWDIAKALGTAAVNGKRPSGGRPLDIAKALGTAARQDIAKALGTAAVNGKRPSGGRPLPCRPSAAEGAPGQWLIHYWRSSGSPVPSPAAIVQGS
jgi:hypothetical protein